MLANAIRHNSVGCVHAKGETEDLVPCVDMEKRTARAFCKDYKWE